MIKNATKDKELKGMVSEIPQIYHEDTVGESLDNVDPFFQSVNFIFFKLKQQATDIYINKKTDSRAQ